MKAQKFLVMIMLLGISVTSIAQQTPTGIFKGSVIDAKTRKPLDYCQITISLSGATVQQVLTNDSGFFTSKPLKFGTYSILVSYLGYQNTNLTIVLSSTNKEAHRIIQMICSDGTSLDEIVVSNKNTKTSKEIMALPQRNVNSIANTSAGSTPSFRGSRSDGTAYYIDGVRVQGGSTTNVPMNAIASHPFIQNNENYAHFIDNNFKAVSSDPLSTFSVDVDRASYTILRRYLNSNNLPPADAVRIEEMINYFPYDIDEKSGVYPFVVHTELCNAPWDSSRKIMQIVLKAPDINLEDAPSSTLTFLIDVSGSMQTPDKLPLLKDCLRLLTQQLRPNDRVAMVVYAGNAGLVLDITKGSDKKTILNAINRLEAGGSTAGGDGIQLAYKIARQHFNHEGNNRVILATDGDFNVGITQIGELTKLIEQERESGVFLSVLGFGTGNINDETMENLADKGNGNYNYIDNLMEGKKVLVNEIGGTLFTVAKDVKLQIEFNPKYVQAYRLIGYENRILNTEDFNNDAKDAGDMGAGHCVTALYELIPTMAKTNAVSVDSMRYQHYELTASGNSNEVANINIRYKDPKAKTSIKFEHPVQNTVVLFDSASQNLRFAVTVAMFGMKLRNAAYTQQISYRQLVKTGKLAKGEDQDGYRAELIKLIQTAELLATR